MIDLVYATANDVTTLEPTLASGLADHTAALAIFGSLVLNFDGRTGEPGYFPWLAESVEPRGDDAWIIRLRSGLTFHDGTPLDAKALKFSFDRILAPDFPSRRYLHTAPIERVDVESDRHVVVRTTEPIAIFHARLLRADASPVAPSRYGPGPASTEWSPVGAGPFRFVEHRRNDRLVLAVNTGFRDPRAFAPNYDRLVLRVIAEPEQLLSELEAGRVDLAPLSPGLVASVQGLSGWSVVAGPDTSRMTFEFNQAAHRALADRRVRKAINCAIDVESLLQRLTGGAGRRIAGLVNPPNAAETIEPYRHDPEESRRLLAEAGWEKGFPISIDWSAGADRGLLADAMVPYLEAVGIRVEAVRQRDWASEYLPGQVEGTLAGLHGHGHAGVEMTVETDLWPLHPNRQANSTNWTGPAAERFVELYGILQRTTDTRRQGEIGSDLQAIEHDEALSVPFWQLPRYVAVSERVAHYIPYPGGHNEDFWTIRMAERGDGK